VTIHLKFCKVAPFRARGDSHWFVNAPALRAGLRGTAGVIDQDPHSKGAPRDDNDLF